MRFFFALILSLLIAGSFASAEPIIDKASPIFDAGTMHEIHIEVSQQAWKMMPPKMYSVFSHLFTSDPATRPTTGPAKQKYVEGQRIAPNLSSLEYAFVKATITIDGEKLHDVGLRMKGNSSYSYAEKTLRVPFKIDFNRFVPAQHFHGLASLNLHNNAFDKSQMREHLAYAIFREAGLPASRTSYAKVFLTIAGKYDHQEIGLYSIVEEVDKDFLKTRFPSNKGLLMKPETVSFGLRDLGDDWKDYTRQYKPAWEATPKQARRVIEFVQLFEKADDKAFRERVESYLNVDQFLRHLAVHTITCNLDSILCVGHNYFLYLNPTDDKFYFIPWDMNLAFAGWVWLGAPEDLVNLSIVHPHVSDNKLIERLLAIDSYNQIYQHHISDLLATVCAPQKLEQQIDQINTLIKVDEKAPTTQATRDYNIKVPTLRDFPRRRAAAIEAQLNGAPGYRPSIRFDRIFNLPPNPALVAASSVKSPTTRPGSGAAKP
jgi:spore coat protein H